MPRLQAPGEAYRPFPYPSSATCHYFPIRRLPQPAYQGQLDDAAPCLLGRPRFEVTLTETFIIREVTMSKGACRLNAVVRSSRPSAAACPNTRRPVGSASVSR